MQEKIGIRGDSHGGETSSIVVPEDKVTSFEALIGKERLLRTTFSATILRRREILRRNGCGEVATSHQLIILRAYSRGTA